MLAGLSGPEPRAFLLLPGPSTPGDSMPVSSAHRSEPGRTWNDRRNTGPKVTVGTRSSSGATTVQVNPLLPSEREHGQGPPPVPGPEHAARPLRAAGSRSFLDDLPRLSGGWRPHCSRRFMGDWGSLVPCASAPASRPRYPRRRRQRGTRAQVLSCLTRAPCWLVSN